MKFWRVISLGAVAMGMTGLPPARAQTAATAQAVDDPAEASYFNAIAAVVNEKVITMAQLKKEVNPLVPGLANQVRAHTNEATFSAAFRAELIKLMDNILHTMVDRTLIIQEFHTKGYAVPKVYLDQIYDDSIVQKFKGDREEFLKTLQENNQTQREYREKLEDDIIINYMRGQLRGTMSGTSPDRVKKFYDQHLDRYRQKEEVKLRQITLRPVANDPPDVLMQQANYIVQQARLPNADFAALAKKYGQDYYQAKGADAASWQTRDHFQPAIADAVFKLEPGQISDPISTGGYVFIFKCEDKHAEGIQPLEQVRRDIEGELISQDAQQAEQKWLEKLRRNAYISFMFGADAKNQTNQ